MFFRSNTYWFDRVGCAADKNGTFIAPVDNTAVVVMFAKPSPGSGQKCFQADGAAHDFGQWINTLASFASLVPELRSSKDQLRPSRLPKGPGVGF